MLAKRIREIRKEAGLRQEEFASSIMVSAKQVGLWERGKARPSDIYLEKISCIYNISREWLITGQSDKYLVSGREMSSEGLINFLSRHEGALLERPGLYSLLTDAAQEKFLIREEEAEYLARTEMPQLSKADYLTELGRYRERQDQPPSRLTPQEMKIIDCLRSIPEEAKQEIMEFLEFKLKKIKKK